MDDLITRKLHALYSAPPWKPCISLGRRVDPGRVVGYMKDMVSNTDRETNSDLIVIGEDSWPRFTEVARGIVPKLTSEIESKCTNHEPYDLCLLKSVLNVVSQEYNIEITGERGDAGFTEEFMSRPIAMSVEEVLFEALETEHSQGEQGSQGNVRIVRVNPFNPDLKYPVEPADSCSGDLERVVAKFLVIYTGLLALYLDSLKQDKPAEASKILYEASLAFLEPSWYLAGGAMLPSNPGMPLFSFFERLYSSLAVLNFEKQNDGWHGCIVKVDLAGVQGWIADSKRIRDMWAASWLASWLTWKSIERLVEKYGPDIMVMPPSFLHPFYITSLVSKIRDEELRSKLAELLGLRKGYPIDPTVPSVALLFIPCNQQNSDEIKNEIAGGYRNAWRGILEVMLNGKGEDFPGLRGLYKTLESQMSGEHNKFNKKVADKIDKLIEKLKKLEPPLPLRVNIIRVEEVARSDIAKEIIEHIIPSIPGLRGNPELVDKLKETLLIPIAIETGMTGSTGLRARGAGSGEGYLKAARFIHREIGVVNCHSCGTGLAVIRGKELEGSKLGDLPGRTKIFALVKGLGRDSLCPYCLLKRWLREILRFNSEPLVGVKMPDEAYSAIGTVTVDAYTTRTVLYKEKLVDAVEKLVTKLEQLRHNGKTAEDIMNLMLSKNVAPVRILDRNKRSELIGKLEKLQWLTDTVNPEWLLEFFESIVVAAAHYKGVPDKADLDKYSIAKQLFDDDFKRIVDNAWSLPRRYAFIAADGDFMGKGVLMGRLGILPRDYIKKALEGSTWIEEGSREKFGKIYNNIVSSYNTAVSQEAREARGSGLTRSIIVSIPYLMSVSRALAAETVLERDAIEESEGMLIYSGGDDLIAVSPPARKTGNGDLEILSIDLAQRLRSTYWGLAGEPKGFNIVPGTGIVVPALTAYGRSTVVYHVDNMRPLWTVFREAHELLEGKDGSFVCTPGKSGGSIYSKSNEKDILVVASDAGGSSVIPITTHPPEIFEISGKVNGLFKALVNRELSMSLLYDVENYWAEYLKLLGKAKFDYAKMIMEKLVTRNANTRVRKDKSKINELLNIISFAKDGSWKEPVNAVNSETGLLAETSRWFLIDLEMRCQGLPRNTMFTTPSLQLIRLMGILKNAVPIWR